jgi:hypothetical protein
MKALWLSIPPSSQKPPEYIFFQKPLTLTLSIRYALFESVVFCTDCVRFGESFHRGKISMFGKRELRRVLREGAVLSKLSSPEAISPLAIHEEQATLHHIPVDSHPLAWELSRTGRRIVMEHRL